MNFVSTLASLTAHDRTRLSKESWLRYAPRLPLLEQARLVPSAVNAFLRMLSEDIPLDSDGPRLPELTKLIFIDVELGPRRTFYLRDILIERVEQGVPLEHLDLRTCVTPIRSIRLLAEIVVDVQEPLDGPWMAIEKYNGWYENGSGAIIQFHNNTNEMGYEVG